MFLFLKPKSKKELQREEWQREQVRLIKRNSFVRPESTFYCSFFLMKKNVKIALFGGAGFLFNMSS